jgi:hypothetical protein
VEKKSRVIDLDAKRIERAKSGDAPPEVILAGRTFALPAEMPAVLALYIGELYRADLTHLDDMLRAVFGDHADEMLIIMTMDDLIALFKEIRGVYNLDLGESPASTEPSENTSTP